MTEEQGRELAEELGVRFMETSAKVNEGVEEAFFTLARCAHVRYINASFHLLIEMQRYQDAIDRLTGRRSWIQCSRGLCNLRFSQGQPTCCTACRWMLLMVFVYCGHTYIFSFLSSVMHIAHVVILRLPGLAPFMYANHIMLHYQHK